MVRVFLLLVILLIPCTESGLISRLRSIFKCGFSRDFAEQGACPRRCQFEYMSCINETFEGCICMPGYVFNHDMTDCISAAECTVCLKTAAILCSRNREISTWQCRPHWGNPSRGGCPSLTLEGDDYEWTLHEIRRNNRRYNISCDFMNYCDLAKIRREGGKLIDDTPIPPCERVDDQTVYWRGRSAGDIYFKGTTYADCIKFAEKKQLFMLSLRRIWEADYKDDYD